LSIVAVVGAGALGGATAHTLASRSGAREIRLIDAAGDVAAGTALDIRQAGPVESFDTVVVASRDPLPIPSTPPMIARQMNLWGAAREVPSRRRRLRS